MLPQSLLQPVGILGIGTALPLFVGKQADLVQGLHPGVVPGSSEERIARRLFRNSRIEERRFCIPDFIQPATQTLYSSPDPTTSQRMEIYRREAPPLAAAACEQALKSARVAPEEITHLVVVSCTGVFVPGPDVELAFRLALRPSVERTLVAFMGCSGAFHGLRVARRAAAESRDARVLLVCVELCSLHRRSQPSIEDLVAQSIFADGAGALVLGPFDDPLSCLVELGDAITHLEPDTRDILTWEIRENGFALHLSRKLPAIVERSVAGFVAPLLETLDRGTRLQWVVHPGGAAVLRAIERALGLDPDEFSSAWSVLRRLGNTSSAAVLYVLEESLGLMAEGEPGIMLGFGPGLTFEALGFHRGERRLGSGTAIRQTHETFEEREGRQR